MNFKQSCTASLKRGAERQPTAPAPQETIRRDAGRVIVLCAALWLVCDACLVYIADRFDL